MDKIDREWDKHGNLPSRLPNEMRVWHAGLYARATEWARDKGGNPELGDDE
jgi:hypothetical protein